jgi:hypothetical protein
MDRGYLDFSRLHTLHQAGAYLVIRARKDLRFVRFDLVIAAITRHAPAELLRLDQIDNLRKK